MTLDQFAALKWVQRDIAAFPESTLTTLGFAAAGPATDNEKSAIAIAMPTDDGRPTRIRDFCGGLTFIRLAFPSCRSARTRDESCVSFSVAITNSLLGLGHFVLFPLICSPHVRELPHLRRLSQNGLRVSLIAMG
jgi:hypothetical protein